MLLEEIREESAFDTEGWCADHLGSLHACFIYQVSLVKKTGKGNAIKGRNKTGSVTLLPTF